MSKIAIIGECMIELNGTPFGSMHQTFGGDTLNAAVYLARSRGEYLSEHKTEVFYVTAIGEDPISDGMLNRWQDEGIKTDWVLRDPSRTPGIYLIQLDDNGERTFLYWRNQSAARYLIQHPGFSKLKHGLNRVDMVFLSGISLAILPPQDLAKLLTLLSELRQSGVEIVFDSNFRPALWPSDDGLSAAKQAYLSMFRTTDLALVTFEDEQLLWEDDSPKATLSRLKALGVKKAVVKLGADGCTAQDFKIQPQPQHIQTTPVNNVVDTTSAGDSFNGGFLSAYLAGATLATACEKGNVLAGIVIQHYGAIIPKEVITTQTNN